MCMVTSMFGHIIRLRIRACYDFLNSGFGKLVGGADDVVTLTKGVISVLDKLL